MLASLVVLLLAAEELSAPPLVSAVEGPPPMPAAVVQEDASPKWNAGAWATATLPTSLEGSPFLFGMRGELDVWRIGAIVTFDRAGTTPFTIDTVDTWNGALGYSVFLNEFLRVRALGAVSARAESGAAVFAPGIGATVRAGWKFIAVEGSALFTPFGAFRQLDARAEAVLVGGIFELHIGARALYLDASDEGSVTTLFTLAPIAGPSVALGLRL